MRSYIIRLEWHLTKIKCRRCDQDQSMWEKRPIEATMDEIEEICHKEGGERPKETRWEMETLGYGIGYNGLKVNMEMDKDA